MRQSPGAHAMSALPCRACVGACLPACPACVPDFTRWSWFTHISGNTTTIDCSLSKHRTASVPVKPQSLFTVVNQAEVKSPGPAWWCLRVFISSLKPRASSRTSSHQTLWHLVSNEKMATAGSSLVHRQRAKYQRSRAVKSRVRSGCVTCESPSPYLNRHSGTCQERLTDI